MKSYFNKEEKESLISRGLTEREVKDINETIHLYYKKYSNLGILKIEKRIYELENIRSLMDESSNSFGVRGDKILRTVIVNYIDSIYKENILYKGLTYRTIRSAAPDYMDMGGTSYYRIFLTNDKLRLYCLDNFFRLIEVKDINLEEIQGIKLFDEIEIEKRLVKIYYLKLKVKEVDGIGIYYMYSTEIMEKSDLPIFNQLLLEKGIKTIELKNEEEGKTSRKIGSWLGIGFTIFIVIVITLRLI